MKRNLIILALGVILAMVLVVAPVAAAVTVNSVTQSGGNVVGTSAGNVAIDFTITAAVAQGGTVAITFENYETISGTPAATLTGGGGLTYAAAHSGTAGSTITYTVTETLGGGLLVANSPYVLTITGGADVINPSTAGNDVTITVTTSAPESGTRDITITPIVTSINPANRGAGSLTTSYVITGDGFSDGDVAAGGVTIGTATSTAVTYNSITTITATVDVSAQTVGAKNVVVVNKGATGTGTGIFTINAAPTFTSITPSSGPTAGSTAVTIVGTNFAAGGSLGVTIGGAAATGVSVTDPTHIAATTPAGTAGAKDVVITNGDSGTVTGAGEYTYVAPPTYISISPTSGPTAGGTAVTITGTDFTSGGSFGVTIDGVDASGVYVNPTTITATAPAHPVAGAVNVVVTNNDGQFDTGVNAYTYAAPPTFASAATDVTGATVLVTFNKNMAALPAAPAGFTVTVNGVPNVVNAVALNADNKIVELTLTTAVASSLDVVTVTYAPGVVKAADGGVLAGFGPSAVTNNKAAGAAPTFVSAATNAAGNTITITFSKAMADPAGKHGEFAYKINGTADQTFSSAALNADTTKIDLTTSGTAIAYGDVITVSYTAGTVKAADNGVLATFANQAVTNNMPNPNPSPPPDNGGGDNNDSDGPGQAPAQGTSSTSEVNVGGNSPVTHVEVTGIGISGVIITGTVVSGPGEGNSPPPGNVYEYMDITPARYTTIDNVVISFTVPVSWLEEHALTPQNIIMYHQVEKTWNALPTTLVKTENGHAYYTAASPGFSRFAISGEINPAEAVQEQTPDNQTFGDMDAATTIPVVSTAAHTPIATQTTKAPPVQPTDQPSSGVPVMIIGVVGIIILIGLGLLIRRWWIRKQNPAL